MVDRKLKFVGLIFIFILGVFYIFMKSGVGDSTKTSKLRILTYSSFTSDYGPGKKLAELFKEKQGTDIEFVNAESALTMLAKIKRGRQQIRRLKNNNCIQFDCKKYTTRFSIIKRKMK